MILLDVLRPDDHDRFLVAVFGVGLIGFSVLEVLRQRAGGETTFLPFDWGSPALRRAQLQSIESILGKSMQSGARLAVLWSAGHAGFLSPEAELDAEREPFTEVLAMAERLALARGSTAFHLVSSAGGLFEGQRRVTARSVPDPRRPYGLLKLQQEQMLTRSTAPLTRRIHRVASAYGFIRHRARAGLVSVMILGGIRRTVVPISGRMTTLRDFVFVGDAASFMAGCLLEEGDGRTSVAFLASARPYSLLEVQHTVEQTIGHRLFVSYLGDAANAEDITFAPDALPSGWHGSDLRANVGMIYRDALARGVAPGSERAPNAL
jgi:UDP-glucose 4-epimerase